MVGLPFDLRLLKCNPIPPLNLDITANSFKVSKIEVIESPFIAVKKQDAIWDFFKQELNIAGVP
ncbi:hypothetical protein HERIO_956 [Hepatospora eriocheir]|uniref:Uncharacterized protein n=1 Tax=Hepatospora eriocheir TaxID=1081669 RepID=A0A1X0QBL8_9MICR|nr:hypothetical protein HERIO_956 [Hepatospora eriocheir]